jgi:POT family proton-dependent oligopeptide transporter
MTVENVDAPHVIMNKVQRRRRQKKQKRSIICRKVILAILVCESAERVSYFGFRAILVLFFTELGYEESIAVSLCAAVAGLAYLSPLLGALLADSVWGRFLTIWRFGACYAAGLTIVTVAAYGLQNDKSLPMIRALTFIGLFMACIGTGGIKPCVSAFGADQVLLGHLGDEHVRNDDDDDYLDNIGIHGTSDETLITSTIMCTERLHDDTNTEPKEQTKDNIYPDDEDSTTTGEAETVREFFNAFYVAINVGALLAFTFIPEIRAQFGFGAAFLLPCLAMFTALAIFMSQRNTYKQRTIGDYSQIPRQLQHDSHAFRRQNDDHQSPSLCQTLRVCVEILSERGVSMIRRADAHSIISSQDDEEAIENANTLSNKQQQVYQDASTVLHILSIIMFYPIFWMLYDQQASVWTLQATRLNLHGLEPEQLQLLNPIQIMVLVPLFVKVLYPWLENKHINIEPLRRMEGGMFLAAVSFLTCAWLQHRITMHPDNSVSVAWQIPQITIISIAEILLNVTGLEFAYSQAPASMQTLILALYLFQTAVGDGLAAILFATIFSHLTVFATMIMCAVFMFINLVFFRRVSRRWEPYNSSSNNIVPNAAVSRRIGEVELQRINNVNID